MPFRVSDDLTSLHQPYNYIIFMMGLRASMPRATTLKPDEDAIRAANNKGGYKLIKALLD